MEKIPFRDFHLLNLMDQYGTDRRPMDVVISQYYRAHRSLGSKDRYEISEAAYALVRWKSLLDTLCPKGTWLDKFNYFQSNAWKKELPSLPPHIQVSCPEELFIKLTEAYGPEKAHQLCLIFNTPAPTCVRVNTAKISRDELLAQWQPHHDVSATKHSPYGIIFHKKVHFFSMRDFIEGYFEIQDEASQLIAELVQAKPGNHVLDYCAGAGGKALAIGPKLNNRGQLYLHDIRAHALSEARQRLKRAGIQNIQMLEEGRPALEKLKKKMDWVLVDAPCTGTGTLRRNPDMKWRYDDALLQRLAGQQRTIFEKALSYLKPDGRIVYATCSILPEENEKQIDHFMRVYDLELEEAPFQSIPTYGSMDGFFGAVLRRK